MCESWLIFVLDGVGGTRLDRLLLVICSAVFFIWVSGRSLRCTASVFRVIMLIRMSIVMSVMMFFRWCIVELMLFSDIVIVIEFWLLGCFMARIWNDELLPIVGIVKVLFVLVWILLSVMLDRLGFGLFCDRSPSNCLVICLLLSSVVTMNGVGICLVFMVCGGG